MIRVKNIYYMLSYAFKALGQSDIVFVESESFENAPDLMAAILAKGLSAQIKRGFSREYVSATDSLRMPRGKIELVVTINNLTGKSRQLVCTFNELSENVYTNQILKASSMLLLHSPHVTHEHKKQLRRAVMFFAGVDDINVKKIDWHRVKYHRNNPSYKLLINLCRLIIDGMIQTETEGPIKLRSFISDQQMSSLFEHFVLEYYKKHYPLLKVGQSFISWAVDDGITDFLPAMHSDITLTKGSKSLIIDTKYYGLSLQQNGRFGNLTVHSANLYQIYAYVKNKDIAHDGSVSGMLLYAKTDETITPDFNYSIDGNMIRVCTLDLGADFQEISSQLNGIADGF